MARYEHTKIKQSTVTLGRSPKPYNITSYRTTIYSAIPETDSDIYVITQHGDRLDNIAFQFYGDQHLWWFIARANNIKAMNVPAGTRLRIPISTENAKGR